MRSMRSDATPSGGERRDEADEPDPEFANQRIALGVAGWAIFYLPTPDGGAYVMRVGPWDYP